MTRAVPLLIYSHVFAAIAPMPLGIWRVRHANVDGHRKTMRGLHWGGLIVAGVFTRSLGSLIRNLVWKGRGVR
ncbi:MAG: hypothetical protein ABI777_03170 [Betaproteobacteria bacterium]